jgi:hypothetical protein
LRRVFTGEFEGVDNIVAKMESGEIVLTPDVTWEELL